MNLVYESLHPYSGGGHYCLNGGECNSDLKSYIYSCNCPQGFKGKNCQLSVVNCPGGKWCTNGGSCGKTTCDCPVGFEGGHCQQLASATAAPGTSPVPSPEGDGGNQQMILTIALPLGGAVLGVGIFMFYMVRQERQGKPIFTPLDIADKRQGGGDREMTTAGSTPAVGGQQYR